MLKTKDITIAEGRDSGKCFRIREMPASKLEKWCARALVAAFGSNAELPAGLAEAARTSNTAALATAGVKCLSGLRWEQVEPLYDELLAQVDRVPDPNKPEAVIRLNSANVDGHVESAATLVKLRAEALGLCLNFTVDGEGWTFLQTLIPGLQGCGTTSTSQPS